MSVPREPTGSLLHWCRARLLMRRPRRYLRHGGAGAAYERRAFEAALAAGDATLDRAAEWLPGAVAAAAARWGPAGGGGGAVAALRAAGGRCDDDALRTIVAAGVLTMLGRPVAIAAAAAGCPEGLGGFPVPETLARDVSRLTEAQNALQRIALGGALSATIGQLVAEAPPAPAVTVRGCAWARVRARVLPSGPDSAFARAQAAAVAAAATLAPYDLRCVSAAIDAALRDEGVTLESLCASAAGVASALATARSRALPPSAAALLDDLVRRGADAGSPVYAAVFSRALARLGRDAARALRAAPAGGGAGTALEVLSSGGGGSEPALAAAAAGAGAGVGAFWRTAGWGAGEERPTGLDGRAAAELSQLAGVIARVVAHNEAAFAPHYAALLRR